MADETLGRAAYELEADNSKLKTGLKTAEQDIAASGKTAEKTWSTSAIRSSELIQTGVKRGAQATAAGAALVFGAATKGGLQLQDVQARYRAETGASADEASAAARTINKVAGDNRMSLDQVADAAARVHNDLGLTGAAADEMTGRIAKFARVTGGDAGTAVSNLDDLTDAYNLTADQQVGILDQLVASHQKYGGSVEENEQALGRMAPQLKALNLNIDDGVGLLNLFAASGLDAGGAQRALNSAIKNIPPGTSFDDIVTKMSSITDDGERAQYAISIFGAKAGAGLANAIKPGMNSLDQFQITAAEAAGTVDKAGEALDSSFSAQIAKRISQAGAAVRQMGSDFGPLVTGLASAGSLLSALKLDDVIGAGFSRLGGSAKVKAAAAAAGAAAGIVYSTAAAGGEKLVELVSGAWSKVGGSPAVLAGASSAGKLAGAAMGAAAVVALAAIAPDIANVTQGWAADIHKGLGLQTSVLGDIGAQWRKFRADTPWPLGQKDAPDWASLSSDTKSGLDKTTTVISHAEGRWADITANATGSMASSLKGGTSEVTGAASTLTSEVFLTMTAGTRKGNAKLIAEHHAAGLREMGEHAKGILEARNKPLSALDDLNSMMKSAMSRQAEVTRLMGALTGKKLRDGLHSSDPAVRAQAQYTKQLIIDRLTELKAGSGKLSKEASALVAKGLKSNDPDIRHAAEHIRDVAKKPLQGVGADAKTYGSSLGSNFAKGIRGSTALVQAAAKGLAGVARTYLQQRSPAKAGPLSEMGGTAGWGLQAGLLYAKGVRASIPEVNRALGLLTAGPSGGFGAPATAALGAIGAGGGTVNVGGTVTHRIELSAASAAALRNAGYSPSEVAQIAGSVDARRFIENVEHLVGTRTS